MELIDIIVIGSHAGMFVLGAGIVWWFMKEKSQPQPLKQEIKPIEKIAEVKVNE